MPCSKLGRCDVHLSDLLVPHIFLNSCRHSIMNYLQNVYHSYACKKLAKMIDFSLLSIQQISVSA
jgi:hypothetical protein